MNNNELKQNNRNTPTTPRANTLKILPLGGMGDVTKNIYVYEYGQDIIVVDCGIGFPEGDLLGVDVVIPDVTYLVKNANKIRAFLITHGHNDHYSALPYILPQIPAKIPVYATKLVCGFVRNALIEFQLDRSTTIIEYNPEGDPFRLGAFTINPFRITHSVPDAAGFVIDCPAGRVVHVADYKFDWTQVDGKVFDVRKLCAATTGGVDILMSDCLGSHKPGFTRSERSIEKSFDLLMADVKGQIFITTTSSNVSRIQQMINSSTKIGRKVALVGRSVRDNVTIAKELGFIQIPKNALIDSRMAHKFQASQLTYIVAGTYGQKGSALDRIAEGESKYASISPGDAVIFSGDPSPSGVKDSVDRVVDKLTRLGADVHYYEIQEDLHVSGHALQGDLVMLAALVHHRYFVPIGGSYSTMRGYTKLLEHSGYNPNSVIELENGETLELSGHVARRGSKIKVNDVFVDGLGVGDVGKKVIEERISLSESGVLILAASVSQSNKLVGEVQVTSRGFVFEKDSGPLLQHIKKLATEELVAKVPSGNLSQVRRGVEEKIALFVLK